MSDNRAKQPQAGPSSQKIAFDQPQRRRRVPDNLRQRTEISCDRCKKRKRRCIRQGEDATCAACEEAGEECRSTLPRKRRMVSSQPNMRYAALDAIVRKLYPDADIDSITVLRSLAEDLGVDIPIPEDGDSHGRDDEHLTSSPHAYAPHQEPLEVPEGWLVPAPRGGHHYVGPASLVYFARCARRIVAKSKTLKNPTYDEAGLRRYRQAAQFTTYPSSHTIEANLQGHPASFAAGTDKSPSAVPSIEGSSALSPSFSVHDSRQRWSQLPDRATADTLMNAFFERVHPSFPIIHRGALQVTYESAMSRILDLALEPGQCCCLYMVFVLGAQALENRLINAQAIQRQYLSIVIRDGLGRLILTSALSNVQALLLLALYQHNAGERNTAYILVGQAIRAAVASGLHKDGENGDGDRREFDPFERNTRRIVWWSLHIFEQTISLALGRPSFTDVIHVNTALPDTSFEQGIGLPANYLEHHVSLSNFMVKVKRTVGITAVLWQDVGRLVEHYPLVIALHSELISWKKSLPSSLSLGQSFASPIYRRLILNLLVWADYLESVLCRPFLLGRVNQDLDGSDRPRELDEIAELSVSAAHASVTKLLILSDHGLLEGSVWLDFYAVQHAIMVMSLQFLGQPDSEEWESSREPIGRLISLSKTICTCPTFRITMNVACQLSCIAGIAPPAQDQFNEPSIGNNRLEDVAGISPDFSAPLMIPSLSAAQDNGTARNSANGVDQITTTGTENWNDFSFFFQNASYGDIYNLGYDADSNKPWDFFDLQEGEDGTRSAFAGST